MTALATWLDDLGAAARDADGAEAALRAEFARRIASVADERAIAYRRLNLMRDVGEAVAAAPDAEAAAAYGTARLRARLGWAEEDGIRAEICAAFAPVCRAMVPADEPDASDAVPAAAPADRLAAFETWYRDRFGSSFWVLFENAMPETPLVDY